ncbi:MAG: xanthine phosphoribosyltransferase, partial [Clostridia bacterium]|nr:xanthine phosphoribosyltransferase [Clostridia bacterium]
MKALEERILKDGKVLPGHVLKVGNFLNHQIDTPFMMERGKEIARIFEGDKPTKILTIEASGIALGMA